MVKFRPESILTSRAIFVDFVGSSDASIGDTGDLAQAKDVLASWQAIASDRETYFTGEEVDLVLAHCLSFRTGEKYIADLDEASSEYRHQNYLTSMSWMSAMNDSWRLFRSPKGYLGMALGRVRHTDRIFVLIGASVPFVLREEQNGLRVISPVFVHGFMDGLAVDLAEKGELVYQDINIC
jgi:hypothetical protein